MGNNLNPRIVFRCDFCGGWSSSRPSHYNRKQRHFCSQRCYSRYRQHILPITEQHAYKGGGMLIKEKAKRAKARSDLNHSISQGIIARQPCEECGGDGAEGHHIDYDIPFLVRWLCKSCHMKEHRRVYENPELLKE